MVKTPDSTENLKGIKNRLYNVGSFVNKPVISLVIISLIGLSLRLFFLNSDLPLTLDALKYFWYASDTSILGHLPTWPQSLSNNGWPMILSIFFSIFHFNNFLDYMTLQRLVTISISILTIIPVYLLCRRFVSWNLALVGVALFALDPRIIQNSLLGLTDALYVFLLSWSFYLSLSNNKKAVYASFAISAFTIIVRSEAIFLFVALSVIFFIRFRKERRVIIKYALAVALFAIILLPILALRIETTGNDQVTDRLSAGVDYIKNNSAKIHEKNPIIFWLGMLENPVKFLGWSMIPTFIFFVPIGTFLVFKNRDYKKVSVIVFVIILLIPIFYALTLAPDTRYLFSIYPLFAVLAVLATERCANKFNNHNLILLVIIIGIILASAFFLHFKNTDVQREKDGLSLAYYIHNSTGKINPYSMLKYLPITEMPNNGFPYIGPPKVINDLMSSYPSQIIPIDGYDSLSQYIKSQKVNGLTHIVVDDSIDNKNFLKDVYNNDYKYPYLTKIFDSTEHGYKYHLKVYKIDYEKFQLETEHGQVLP